MEPKSALKETEPKRSLKGMVPKRALKGMGPQKKRAQGSSVDQPLPIVHLYVQLRHLIRNVLHTLGGIHASWPDYKGFACQRLDYRRGLLQAEKTLLIIRKHYECFGNSLMLNQSFCQSLSICDLEILTPHPKMMLTDGCVLSEP